MSETYIITTEGIDTVSEEVTDRWFNPWRRAASPQAMILVKEILYTLLAYEQTQNHRKRARKAKDQWIFEQQIEALVCDLLYQQTINPAIGISITRSKAKLGKRSRYQPLFMTENIIRVIDLMASPDLDIVEEVRGCKINFDGAIPRQTFLKAGVALKELVNRHGLTPYDFTIQHDGELIILRSDRENHFDGPTSLEYVDTPTTHLYRTQVQELNRWLYEADIEFDEGTSEKWIDSRDRGLRRIFNNGSFEQGGRLYGGFWQRLNNRERLEGISINGHPVTILDYGQIAPRIMYSMTGVQPHFEDAYLIPGYERYREGMKKLLNTLLYTTRRPSRFPKGVRNLFSEDMRLGNVLDPLLAFHAPIAHLLCAGRGLEAMFRESQLLLATMMKLKSLGIVGLPIHDALIVEKSHTQAVKEVMTSMAKEHLRVDVPVNEET